MRELSIGSLWLNISTHIQVLNFGLGAHIFLHQSQDLSVLRYSGCMCIRRGECLGMYMNVCVCTVLIIAEEI